MDFQLADLLKIVGTTASLVFASWIFMGFLQQRYTGAYARFRSLVDEYRRCGQSPRRQQNIYDQIVLYRQRCARMRYATNIGMVSAILLPTALVSGALHVVFPKNEVLKLTGAIGAIVGLLLMMVAAVLVIFENSSLVTALDSEMEDIQDIRKSADQGAGRNGGAGR